ncbi:MAG TPA: tRNA (adenosine(37)-N6)-threonylcarbamoyltransferase complex dimerization subunit type 1 TsaB [Candidatus Saccharimonadales bacterium]
MLILTIRTDKPDAEIGLFEDGTKLAYSTWAAHRQLAETIHLKIKEILEAQSRSLADLEGIVVFKGPGSFTGLRIGMSVANALAYSLGIPLASKTEDTWIAQGSEAIKQGTDERIAAPEYGALPHITVPKK